MEIDRMEEKKIVVLCSFIIHVKSVIFLLGKKNDYALIWFDYPIFIFM